MKKRNFIQRDLNASPTHAIANVGFVIKAHDKNAVDMGKRIIKNLQRLLPETSLFVEKIPEFKGFGSAKVKLLPLPQLLQKSSLAIIIGGDGTILRCTRSLLDSTSWQNCSVLGVNAGKLGFLAAISGRDAIHRLPPLLRKPSLFRFEPRSCLRVEIIRKNRSFKTVHVLNDVVLSKGSLSRLFEYHLDINGEFVSSYRADGMIVSTPTGSTAYNLAAGGSILQPNIPALQLTPIAAQHFSNKPIVISDENEVVLRLGKHSSDVYLTFDGQTGLQVQDEDRISITRSEKNIQFLAPRSAFRSHFFHSLRQKLNWGLVEKRGA